MKARVVRGDAARFARAHGHPTVLWKDRVEVDCGCAALVGVRLDRYEWTVVAAKCEIEAHTEVMERFVAEYAELAGRGPLDLIREAARLLSRAFTNLEEA